MLDTGESKEPLLREFCRRRVLVLLGAGAFKFLTEETREVGFNFRRGRFKPAEVLSRFKSTGDDVAFVAVICC